MKKSLLACVIIGILTLLIAACGETSASSIPSPASTPKANQPTLVPPGTVHMGNSQFEQSEVTIKKGESVTLVDDVAVVHVVANGTWQSNGNAKYQIETGAPKVDVQFNGNDSHHIGPFNTAGTFHLYCTVHQGMNLTVVVG